MPLLDWRVPKGISVVSHRFWVYWAVTIPLTGAVLLLWSIWYLLSGHWRAQLRKARPKGSISSPSGQKELEMDDLTAIKRNRLRKRSNGLVGSGTAEILTGDMA